MKKEQIKSYEQEILSLIGSLETERRKYAAESRDMATRIQKSQDIIRGLDLDIESRQKMIRDLEISHQKRSDELNRELEDAKRDFDERTISDLESRKQLMLEEFEKLKNASMATLDSQVWCFVDCFVFP